jgi:hypothetical protein
MGAACKQLTGHWIAPDYHNHFFTACILEKYICINNEFNNIFIKPGALHED